MRWTVEFKKKFLKELHYLPQQIQQRIETIVFQELPQTDNPFSLGFLEKMSGYPGKYKIRIGNYRMGISLDKKNHLIIVERVAHRKDIYRIFP
ncbi:MAG: type II toxin-antitoxin system RelE/ParE family toxin [Cytophagales bacterium]|nr:type II toxin-antitoxin system RelE/ParE family toxin [Cytophagales bacterium]